MNIFEALSNAHSAPGAEKGAMDVIKEYFNGKASEITSDSMGNLIVRLGEDAENTEKTAIFASVDAPGLVVTYIEDNGTVKVSSLGKCDYRSACCSIVTNGRITGILVPDNGEADSADKSHVNFGFKDCKEAESELSQGDVLFFKSPLVSLKNGVSAGVGLCDKAIAAAMCMAAEKFVSCKCIYLVFCTQGELMGRGAYPAAFGVKPDKALCIAPGTGKSFAVKVLDKTLVCDKELTDRLYDVTCKHAKDAVKRVYPTEMSDASKVQSAYSGIKVASLIFPAGNLGSLVETVSDADIKTASEIIAEFLNNI